MRPATLSRYDSHWRWHLAPSLGGYRLGAITRLQVEELVTRMRAADVGPSTAGAVLRLLHRLLAAAVASGLIGRNPATGVREL
ncbi:MAG: hypothetical protein ACRDWD_09425 [Acidimicrobiia bacterium]